MYYKHQEKTMTEINLKKYTAKATELEIALHTQKRLMSEHEAIIKNQRPVAPQKRRIPKPNKPIEPTLGQPWKAWAIAGGLFLVLGLLILLFMFDGYGPDNTAEDYLYSFGAIIAGIILLFVYFSEKNNIAQAYEVNKKIYEKKWKEYTELLKQHQQDISANEEYYKMEMKDFSTNLSEYENRYSGIMEEHNSAFSLLEDALEKLYSEDIIFPKYRNLVAISAINEYLLSGRCDTLEGPNGAYNLYEQELRQNIIITQLSNIIEDLEQIKTNQFSLYQELQRSNDTINEILDETRELKETSKLTAYYSRISAIADTSPKIYYGYTI